MTEQFLLENVSPRNINNIMDKFDETTDSVHYDFDDSITDLHVFSFFLKLFVDFPTHQQYLLTNIEELLAPLLENPTFMNYQDFVQEHISYLLEFFNILFQTKTSGTDEIFNIFGERYFVPQSDMLAFVNPGCFFNLLDIYMFLSPENQITMFNFIHESYNIETDEMLKGGYAYLIMHFFPQTEIHHPSIIPYSIAFSNDTSVHDIIYQKIEILQDNSDILSEILECFTNELVHNLQLTYHMEKIISYLVNTKDSTFGIRLCSLLIEKTTDLENPINIVDFFTAFFTHISFQIYSKLTEEEIQKLFKFYSGDFINVFQLQALVTSLINLHESKEIWQKIEIPANELADRVYQYCEQGNERIFILFRDYMENHVNRIGE